MTLLRTSISALLTAVPALSGIFAGGPGALGNIGANVGTNPITVTVPQGFASSSAGGGLARESSSGQTQLSWIGAPPCAGPLILCSQTGGPPEARAIGHVNAAQGSIRAGAEAIGSDTGAQAWLGFNDLIVFGTPTLNVTLDINSLFAANVEATATVDFSIILGDPFAVNPNVIFSISAVEQNGNQSWLMEDAQGNSSFGTALLSPFYWALDLSPYTVAAPLNALALTFQLDVTATCGFDATCLATARADNSLYMQIPGTYSSANGYIYAGPLAATVPEPVSLILVGAGLAGLAGLRRRRKAHRPERPMPISLQMMSDPSPPDGCTSRSKSCARA